MRKRPAVYLIAIGISVIVWVVLPSLLNRYWVNVLTETLVYGLYAMGLSILVGYMGFPSLGQSAFFGTGAYALGISLVRLGQGQEMSILFAIVSIFVVAAVLGLLVLHTRGIYFLFITLSLAQILWAIAWKWYSVTGGDDGLVGIQRPDLGLPWWDLSNANNFYYFVLLIFLLAFLALLLVTRSPLGRSFIGIRESEARMSSLGYNVWLHSYLAFILSGLFSGLAGILFAWYNMFVATQQLSIALSAEGLFMVILGGGTIWGAFLGSTVIVFMKHIASMLTAHWLFVMGAFYIAIIIYMPQGISAILRKK
jgi:branched-chain amino acid transport system permease protein